MNALADTTRGAKIVSLGCRLNIAESERMAALLAQESGLVVVNSCAVTEEAVRQTRKAIRRARREHPTARLLVTGCAADIERSALGAMDEVDGLVPNATKLDARAWNVALPPAMPRSAPKHTRAFIAVQNGCDHACTFCVIPQGRGQSRSLSIEAVLREVERHLEAGAAEVVLTGVDLTSWGGDLAGKPALGSLVLAILDRFRGLKRLRLSSLDGIEIDPELIELFCFEERLMPYLHLSMQHGSNLILKRMKRRHLRGDAIELIERLKTARSDLAVGADLIAGFPTETETHHADNLSIIRDLDIVHGHIFPYSPRSNTPAARMPQHERATIKARAKDLREAVAAQRTAWLDSLVGTDQSILVESDRTGYALNYARISAPPAARRGDIVNVTPLRHNKDLLI